jgi:hypothetical protein
MTTSGPYRPFCDWCGIRFEEGHLRPTSKFCHRCGEELLPSIREALASLRVPATQPIAPALEPVLFSEHLVHSETEDEAVYLTTMGKNKTRRGRKDTKNDVLSSPSFSLEAQLI